MDVKRVIKHIIREREGKEGFTTEVNWVKAHIGIEGNEWADKMADEGREKENEWMLYPEKPGEVWTYEGRELDTQTGKWRPQEEYKWDKWDIEMDLNLMRKALRSVEGRIRAMVWKTSLGTTKWSGMRGPHHRE